MAKLLNKLVIGLLLVGGLGTAGYALCNNDSEEHTVTFYQDYLNRFDYVYHFTNDTNSYVRLDKDTKLIKTGTINFLGKDGKTVLHFDCVGDPSSQQLFCKYSKDGNNKY